MRMLFGLIHEHLGQCWRQLGVSLCTSNARPPMPVPRLRVIAELPDKNANSLDISRS